MSRTHSPQCLAIGGGPGHDACVCFCHGTDGTIGARLDEQNRADSYPPATDWPTRVNDAYWLGWRDSQIAMQASALAAEAPRTPPVLDVERLREAVVIADDRWGRPRRRYESPLADGPIEGMFERLEAYADDIAAEYARLAPQRTEPQEPEG